MSLMAILPGNLKKDLTSAEEYFLDKAQKGGPTNFRTGDKEKDDPTKAAEWGPERTVRAELIYWLCTDKAAASLVHERGRWIEGAKIAGPLNFEGGLIPHMGLFGCALETVILRDASAGTLVFNNSVIGGLSADGLKMSGALFMRNVKAAGEVRLLGAFIGGDLDCCGAEFNNPGGDALSADGITVKRNVFLREIKTKGEVSISGADIGGNLECSDAEFNNSGGITLFADGLKVKGDVFLRNGFKAAGEVSLSGADIGGQLNCQGAEFNNPGGDALSTDRIKVKGTVFFRDGFKAVGKVWLLGADIGENLDCSRAEFNNPDGNALQADGLKVKEHVLLRDGFKASGAVSLSGADIGGNLECLGAKFDNPNGDALRCYKASITGALFLFQLKGLVGALDLRKAKVVDTLVDDRTGWPEAGKLYIDRFEYGDLAGYATPNSARWRLEWLRLQPTKPFYPRPYEQLARVFRDMGQKSDAREVLIAKQKDLRKYGNLSRNAKAWNWFLGFTIGYGYDFWRPLVGLIVSLLMGWGVFGWANNAGIMQCSKECSMGNTFNPFMYSLDVLLPVINFHQKDYFFPDATKLYGYLVRWYFWMQIAFGWVFSAWVAIVKTDLFRKLLGKE